MNDHGAEPEALAHPVLCARCRRTSRDEADSRTWVILDGEQICTGCLSQTDRERLPLQPRRDS
jgi:hypothetical protein